MRMNILLGRCSYIGKLPLLVLAIVLMYLGIEGQFCKASINNLNVFTKEIWLTIGSIEST